MKNKKITEGQLDVLKTIGELSEENKKTVFSDKEISASNGRAIRSVRGFLGKLTDQKLITKRKKGFALLKLGRITLVSEQTNKKVVSTLKQMSINDIENLDASSLSHLSGLFLKADSLPPAAVNKLVQAVEKHGKDVVEKQTGVEAWPNIKNVEYLEALNYGRVKGNGRFRFQTKLSIQVKYNKNFQPFGTGRALLISTHPVTNLPQDIFYYSAVNFEGKALDKITSELNKNMSGDGTCLIMVNILATGYINLIKPFKSSANPTLQCLDYIKLEE